MTQSNFLADGENSHNCLESGVFPSAVNYFNFQSINTYCLESDVMNVEDKKQYMKDWWKEHPEKKRDYDRQYYERYKTEIRAKRQKARKENPEKVREQNKKHHATAGKVWKENNHERVLLASRRFRQNHSKELRLQEKEYRKNNPSKILAKNHRQRARRIQAEGCFTDDEWESLKIKYDNRCACCGEQAPNIKLTVDHIIPISKGGMNYISNIQPLCKSCNCKKVDKLPEEFSGMYEASEIKDVLEEV